MTQEQLKSTLHFISSEFYAALIYGGTGYKYNRLTVADGQTKGEDTGSLNHTDLIENPDPICLVLLSLTAMSPQ